LLGAALGVRARHLAASGQIAEARRELTKTVTLFDQARMTKHLERAKAALSKLSGI
jgi:hypothetical protein